MRSKEELADQMRRAHFRRKYGITVEEYDVLLAEQRGVCAICRLPERRLFRGSITRLAVDHVKDKDGNPFVRGLLCHKCNRGIGLLGDSSGMLGMAMAYVVKNHFAMEEQRGAKAAPF